MKMKAIRHRSAMRLLVIVTLITCAFAAEANAQSSFTGRFTLPYEVHWGKVVLPAGDYSITMESSAAPALVRSASGENKMFTSIPVTAESEKGAACLVITLRGNERRVRSLNLPRLGTSLIYEPLSNTERELLAKEGQIQTVPVSTARK
jgi:hypothetical protein